jgi:hypothetical protein
MLDPSLRERAYASALPGKEAVALNEALRAIIEALRRPQRSSPVRFKAYPSQRAARIWYKSQ